MQSLPTCDCDANVIGFRREKRSLDRLIPCAARGPQRDRVSFQLPLLIEVCYVFVSASLSSL